MAGPAARERYALAEVGVEDKDVVEVGRPQLAPIRPYAGRRPTGHVHDRALRPHLGGLGRQPGQHLGDPGRREHRPARCSPTPGVRLLYKPHPMTGSVDPRAGAARTSASGR